MPQLFLYYLVIVFHDKCLLRKKNETFTKPTINFTVLLALRQVCRCAPLSIISLKTRDKHSHMRMLCTSLPASLIEKQYRVLGMCALIRLITCFYTQYRMCNAIMRNRLKGDLSQNQNFPETFSRKKMCQCPQHLSLRKYKGC